MKKKKFIFRVCVLPFILGLLICTGIYNSLRCSYLFLRYGGEFIAYVEGDENRIYGIYQKLIESENE